ncbi:MAG: TIGR03936 family radical SAM-associated protein [Bacillota bacterium]|jgi:radical SAM-linked protein
MKVRVKYAKGDRVRFLSHLDLARVMRMALKRAKWPVAMTKGYSPKMKVSFYAPLPVGTSGEEEYMDVHLDHSQIGFQGAPASPQFLVQLTRALSGILPEGFSVSHVFAAPGREKPFESQILGSLYRVHIEEVNTDSVAPAIEAFLDRKQVLFDVERPTGIRTVDLRKFVCKISLKPDTGSGSDSVTLFMRIKHENGRTVRPQWVIGSLSGFGLDINTSEVIVDRLKIYFD